jgi:inner membrane protein
MDTVTQALLGGAVAYTVAGKESSRKAVAWGAIIAVLPDLDIFIAYENDLTTFTQHRSWTHSWFIQTLLAPFLAYFLFRIDQSFSKLTWLKIVWLALVTHSALDALTVYGTQLFWPLMPSPISGGSIFIIDPVYSIPLLIGVLYILVKPHSLLARKTLLSSFIISCCYLIWGLMMQQLITTQVKNELMVQNIHFDKVQVSATPLNTLLWKVLVINDKYYYQSFRSLFDKEKTFDFSRYNRHPELIPSTESIPALRRLNWFTSGFFALEKQQDKIIAKDLRMGLEPNYFFQFQIATMANENIIPLIPNHIKSDREIRKNLQRTWLRIWNSSQANQPEY